MTKRKKNPMSPSESGRRAAKRSPWRQGIPLRKPEPKK